MQQQDQHSETGSSTQEPVTKAPQAARREYEKSGLYPPDGKPFRLWALLGWLTALIALLAAVSALLNILILGSA